MKRKERICLAGDFRALEADLPRLVVHLPAITCEARMTIHGSVRTIELHTLGGGHSPGDTFLYLPTERIAFMAKLLLVNVHPALRFGNPAEWVRMRNQVATFNLDVVVPGHGPVGSRSHLVELRDFIQWLTDCASESVHTLPRHLPPSKAWWVRKGGPISTCIFPPP